MSFLFCLKHCFFPCNDHYEEACFSLSQYQPATTFIDLKSFLVPSANLKSTLQFRPFFPTTSPRNMAGPDYGALGATFKLCRILQAISLLGIIGMAANFISEMVSNNNAPSDVLVGTLSVVCNYRSGSCFITNESSIDLYSSALLRNHLYPVH